MVKQTGVTTGIKNFNSMHKYEFTYHQECNYIKKFFSHLSMLNNLQISQGTFMDEMDVKEKVLSWSCHLDVIVRAGNPLNSIMP